MYPIIIPKAYPVAAPMAAVRGSQIQVGAKFIINKPAKNNGTRYASGMMRRRKSATEIAIAHATAPANKSAKNK